MCQPDNNNKIGLLKLNDEGYIHNTYDNYNLLNSFVN